MPARRATKIQIAESVSGTPARRSIARWMWMLSG
jgi:hypothetical protein